MQQLLAERDTFERAYLHHWNFSDPEFVTSLFQIVGDLYEGYEDFLAGLDAVDAIRKYDVRPVNDRGIYVYLKESTRDHSQGFRDLFVNTDILVVPPVEYRTGGEVVIEAVGDAEDLQAIIAGLPDRLSVLVDWVSEYDAYRETPIASLTDRQREVLSVARELGYYEIPRQASVREVADQLDCSKSTAANHLRKAEARLVALCGERNATRQDA